MNNPTLQMKWPGLFLDCLRYSKAILSKMLVTIGLSDRALRLWCSVPSLLTSLVFIRCSISPSPLLFHVDMYLTLFLQVFFTMVFAIGLSSGVIENFAYKRLRELGGTGSVLGVSRLVSSLSGIPMFFFSGAIVKHFSMVSILTASMMSFIARYGRGTEGIDGGRVLGWGSTVLAL